MTEQSDDPELAAQRLEAALERIARLSAAPVPGIPAPGQGGTTVATTVEMPPDVVTGLDALIENLRAALGRPLGDRPD